MQRKFLGDSYDVVKRSLLNALDNSVAWMVHPMLTPGPNGEEFTGDGIADYERLIGARVVSRRLLTPDEPFDSLGRRDAFFDCARSVANLFIDPDTGLRTIIDLSTGLRKRRPRARRHR